MWAWSFVSRAYTHSKGALYRNRTELAWAAALAALAVMATRASWQFSGWPINHEFYAHFERVETFRRAYAAGDWFPLWTPFSNNGHGSPIPFFYHRLFNTVAGLFALVSKSTYVGVKAAVTAFMFVGAFGMDRAARDLGASRAVRLAAAGLFVFSPYVMTDWLTRGSTAEFVAFMLAPFLLQYCLRATRGEAVGGRLGVVVALMYYAHNVVCYFALLVPLTAAIIAIVKASDRGQRLARAKVFVIAGCVFFLIAGPYLLAVVLTGKLFDIKALTLAWSPLKTMRPLKYYLTDPSFDWGRQWQGLSVEIGLPSVIAAALMIVLAATARARIDVSALALLLSTLAVFMFLQTPSAGPFYLKFPGAMYLGFPWRLLALIVTQVILFLALLSASLKAAAPWRRDVGVLLLLGAAAWQADRSFHAQDVKYGRYTKAQIEKKVTDLEVPTIGEYLPAGVGGLRRIPARQPLVAWTDCASVKLSGTDPTTGAHLRRLIVEATSPQGCKVRLNQFASPFLRVGGVASKPSDTAERTIELMMPPGTQVATVSPRGLWGLIVAALRR